MYFNKHILEDRKEPIRSFTTIKNGWDRDLETGSSYLLSLLCSDLFDYF